MEKKEICPVHAKSTGQKGDHKKMASASRLNCPKAAPELGSSVEALQAPNLPNLLENQRLSIKTSQKLSGVPDKKIPHPFMKAGKSGPSGL